MRPRSYLLVAVASAAAVLVAGWATRTNECVQTSPTWVTPFVYLLGAVSLGAIFASVLTFGRQQGGNIVAWLIPALIGAAIWGVVGLFALFVIVVPNGCLD